MIYTPVQDTPAQGKSYDTYIQGKWEGGWWEEGWEAGRGNHRSTKFKMLVDFDSGTTRGMLVVAMVLMLAAVA